MGQVTRLDGIDAVNGGIGSIFKALAMAPQYKQQAQDQAALREAQMYAQNMAGNKHGAEAEGIGLTNGYRRQLVDGTLNVGEMPETTRFALKTFGITGKGDPHNIAQASGDYQTQGIRQQAVDNIGDVEKMNQFISIAGNKAYEPYAAVGDTGRSINKATGLGKIVESALAGNYDGKVKSEAAENHAQAGASRASAANSYASAEQHRASTAKIKQDTELGGRGIYDTNRGIIINPRTGEAVDVVKGGVPVGAKEVLAKALPTAIVKDLDEKVGIADTSDRLATTFKDGYGGHTLLGDWSNTWKRVHGDESGQSQWWQDYALHEAKVRNSLFGASLTAGEQAAWDRTSINARMDPDQISQNLKRRAEIEKKGLERAMRGAAAGGYNRTQIEELTGRKVPGAPGDAGPKRITSKQQYDAMPSGTRFIDPNGEERIKP